MPSNVDLTADYVVAAERATYGRLLRVPGFRQLLISSLLTRTASQMWTVGLVLFALQRYHSASVAGVGLFLLIFPGLLMSPIAGALLDRHGRKRLMTLDFAVAAVCLTVIVTLAAAGVTARDVQLDSSNLEDAFVRLTGRHLDKEGATS